MVRSLRVLSIVAMMVALTATTGAQGRSAGRNGQPARGGGSSSTSAGNNDAARADSGDPTGPWTGQRRELVRQAQPLHFVQDQWRAEGRAGGLSYLHQYDASRRTHVRGRLGAVLYRHLSMRRETLDSPRPPD